MAERRPPPAADGREDAVPDVVDDERLSLAMAALLGGAWPGPAEEGAAPAFTLPPPRRFEADDPGLVEPEAEASLTTGIWEEPVPGEHDWVPPEHPSPPEAWFGPPEAPVPDGPSPEASEAMWDVSKAPPADDEGGQGRLPVDEDWAAAVSSPLAGEAWAPPVGAAGSGEALPEPWGSTDESTQAHTWSPVDDGPHSSESESAPRDPQASDDAPAASGDWWSAGADTGPVVGVGPVDVDAPVLSSVEPSWRPAGAPWTNEPLQPAAPAPEPEDQVALEQAGLAGPMNTALTDLRRLGGVDADVTDLAAPVAAGSYAGSGKLAELQDWWSDRGRELLPGLAVVAVVIFAFAVVLLGRDSDPDGSKVNTGRATVSTFPSVPTTVPDLSTASEPLMEETFGEPVFSEPAPAGGSGTPTAKKTSPSPTTRRPSSGAPAAGPGPAPPGGSTDTTAPQGSTDTTARPNTTTTTEPDQTTTTVEPPVDRTERCALVPLDRLEECLHG